VAVQNKQRSKASKPKKVKIDELDGDYNQEFEEDDFKRKKTERVDDIDDETNFKKMKT
jgi:hypothetical protein